MDELLARLGSDVVAVTLAVLLMVELLASLELAFTTTVKVALAPAAKLPMLPLRVPVPPTGGLAKVKVGPVFCASDTKVVPAGTASVRLTDWASDGPPLVSVMV